MYNKPIPLTIKIVLLSLSLYATTEYNIFQYFNLFKNHYFDIALYTYPLCASLLSDLLVTSLIRKKPTVEIIFHKKNNQPSEINENQTIKIPRERPISVFFTLKLIGDKTLLRQYQLRLSVPNILRIQPYNNTLQDDPESNSIVLTFDNLISEDQDLNLNTKAECRFYLLSNTKDIHTLIPISTKIERNNTVKSTFRNQVWSFIINYPNKVNNNLFITN